MDRIGYGIGQGMGFKNLVPQDPYTHSLNAKGVKSKAKGKKKGITPFPEKTDFISVIRGKGMRKDFGWIPTPQKKGLIRELARKAKEGVDWAVAWEKEHLPSQKAWVKKEFELAKQEIGKGVEKGKKAYQDWKLKQQEKKDLDDVRDELDVNNDGIQDISMATLEKTNDTIVTQLDSIDMDKDGVPDHREEGFTELTNIPVGGETAIMPSYTEPVEDVKTNLPIPFMTGQPEPQPEEIPIEPVIVDESPVEVEYETKMGVPFPFMTGVEQKPEPKPTFLQKAGKVAGDVSKKGYEFAKKEYEVGKKYVEKKQQETRELHQMADAEVKKLAIQEGQGMFGGLNKYEKELIRREKEKIFLDKKLKEVKEGKPEGQGSGLGNAFGFLNPVATLSQAPSQAKQESANSGLGESLSFLNPLSAFKPSVKSAPVKERYYNQKLKPKLQKLNKGFNPLGFLNPVDEFKTIRR